MISANQRLGSAGVTFYNDSALFANTFVTCMCNDDPLFIKTFRNIFVDICGDFQMEIAYSSKLKIHLRLILPVRFQENCLHLKSKYV